MSLRDSWSGDRVGVVVVADEEFCAHVSSRRLAADTVELPNGVTLEGVEGRDVRDFIPLGTLALGVRLAGDCFNQYVPLSVTQGEDGVPVLQSFNDLEFGAYNYGVVVGHTDDEALTRLMVGLSAPCPDLRLVTNISVPELP